MGHTWSLDYGMEVLFLEVADTIIPGLAFLLQGSDFVDVLRVQEAQVCILMLKLPYRTLKIEAIR